MDLNALRYNKVTALDAMATAADVLTYELEVWDEDAGTFEDFGGMETVGTFAHKSEALAYARAIAQDGTPVSVTEWGRPDGRALVIFEDNC